MPSQTIYLQLVSEGTEVWRPVNAELVADQIFRIVDPQPEDELWEFSSGAAVHCELRVLSGEACLVATQLASIEKA